MVIASNGTFQIEPVVPLIGVPAKDLAENGWHMKSEEDDEYTLSEVEEQRQQIACYGGYAIFDTGTDAIHDRLALRNGCAVHITGESQSANPFQFGTLWVVEFEDGYTSLAYFDELCPISDSDFVDHFGKSMNYDARSAIYAAAEHMLSHDYGEEERHRLINERFDEFIEKRRPEFEHAVETVMQDNESRRKLYEELKSVIVLEDGEYKLVPPEIAYDGQISDGEQEDDADINEPSEEISNDMEVENGEAKNETDVEK